MRALRTVLFGICILLGSLLITWAAGALYFDLPAPGLVRAGASSLYRLMLPIEEVRTALREYLNRLNELFDHPMWYNAVTENCTTSIRAQRKPSKRMPWDWRLLVNGFMDRMLYEQQLLAGNLPFPELRERALINQPATEAGDGADFSKRIRAGAPGFESSN